MSTIFYGFKATSDENLAEQVGAAKYLSKKLRFVNEGVDFQVFRTSRGIIYRVLEAGHGMQNLLWKDPQFFRQCNYDDRSDVPERDLKNKDVAEEIDHMIESGQCYIVNIRGKSGMTVQDLIVELSKLPAELSVMIMAKGIPSNFSMGPTKSRITESDAENSADCENRVGEEVVLIGCE